MSQPVSKKNNIWGEGSPPSALVAISLRSDGSRGATGGHQAACLPATTLLAGMDVQAPGDTRGSGVLHPPTEGLGMEQSPSSQPGTAAIAPGGRRAWGSSGRLGVPSASLVPAGSHLAPGSRAAGANPLSGVLPGDFQLLLPDASAESPRRCWESFPNPAPGALPHWQPSSARGWQQHSQPLPVLHPQTHAELSPRRPPEAGSVGEGRWREDLEEEAS